MPVLMGKIFIFLINTGVKLTVIPRVITRGKGEKDYDRSFFDCCIIHLRFRSGCGGRSDIESPVALVHRSRVQAPVALCASGNRGGDSCRLYDPSEGSRW